MIHWLASYPKSGNTWVRMLVRHYADLSKRPVDAQHGDNTAYWWNQASPVPVNTLNLREQLQMRGAAIAHLQCFVTKPSLVKTHHWCGKIDGVPLFSSIWTTGIVYVVRDPRDIVASLKNHMNHDTLDESIAFMDHQAAIISQEGVPDHWLNTWSEHVRSWLDVQEIAEPLVVRYEDMQEDTHRELRRILDHMGDSEPDEDALDEAVELCQLDRLKEREKQMDFPEKPDHAERFFRKGEVGGYREELTSEQVERVESAHGEMMERLGYEPATATATVA